MQSLLLTYSPNLLSNIPWLRTALNEVIVAGVHSLTADLQVSLPLNRSSPINFTNFILPLIKEI
jgi:hypothetical protein